MSEERNPESNKTDDEFTYLLLTHQRRLYGFILSLVPNFSDADDIFQDTVLVMSHNFHDLSDKNNFLYWGFGIARHKIIKFRQKATKSPIHFSGDAFDAIVGESVQTLDHLDERTSALEKCMSKLTGSDKALLKMRYEKGLKINRIAEKVNRPVQGMYKVFVRIHLGLRECVKRTLSMGDAT